MWWYFIAKKHPVQVEALSSVEWDSVASKAAACALIDGDGVLDARGLLPLVSDIIIIDGTQCDEYDEEQSPSLTSLKDGESLMSIDIVPNPASTGWSILRNDQELLRYTVYSANGG